MDLKKLGTWGFIRSFATIKYFNISYVVLFFMPLIYELYKQSSPLMAYLGLCPPFPKSLVYAYLASLFYAFGIAFYQFFCPPEIKRFGHIDEYVESQFDFFLRAHPDKRLGIVLANLDHENESDLIDSLATDQNRINNLKGSKRENEQKKFDATLINIHKDAVQRFLLKKYETLNNCRGIARTLSIIFYFAGSVIILILLYQRSLAILLGT
jgi:hypothetical protein